MYYLAHFRMTLTILSVFQWTSSTEQSVTDFDIRSCPRGITPTIGTFSSNAVSNSHSIQSL